MTEKKRKLLSKNRRESGRRNSLPIAFTSSPDPDRSNAGGSRHGFHFASQNPVATSIAQTGTSKKKAFRPLSGWPYTTATIIKPISTTRPLVFRCRRLRREHPRQGRARLPTEPTESGCTPPARTHGRAAAGEHRVCACKSAPCTRLIVGTAYSRRKDHWLTRDHQRRNLVSRVSPCSASVAIAAAAPVISG